MFATEIKINVSATAQERPTDGGNGDVNMFASVDVELFVFFSSIPPTHMLVCFSVGR